MLFKKWKPYDPTWLVEDCQVAYEAYPWLKNALMACHRAKKSSMYYTYFEKNSSPNKPFSNWQFQDTIIIEGTREGIIHLDIIKKDRVGGIEFYSRLIE